MRPSCSQPEGTLPTFERVTALAGLLGDGPSYAVVPAVYAKHELAFHFVRVLNLDMAHMTSDSSDRSHWLTIPVRPMKRKVHAQT